MKNLSRHTDLLCELETSLLMREIQMGEMFKLGWLIGLVNHAIWANSLYFLYLLLLSISALKAVVVGGEWSASRLGSFTTGTHWIGC
jgi:hypothetical protein